MRDDYFNNNGIFFEFWSLNLDFKTYSLNNSFVQKLMIYFSRIIFSIYKYR